MKFVSDTERSVLKVTGSIVGTLGVFTAVSPLVFHYANGSQATIIDFTLGTLIAVIGWSRSMFKTRDLTLAWLNVAFGLCLIAASWPTDFSNVYFPMHNNLVVGTMVVVVATWGALASSGHRRVEDH